MNPSIGVQFALGFGQALQGMRYLSLADFSERYNLTVPRFIEQSKTSSSLDWAVFQAMQSNTLDIAFDSYINTMGTWATKTSVAASQSSPISQIYYPPIFEVEQSANFTFEMPAVSNASAQLSAMMASHRNRIPIYHGLPVFTYESNAGSTELKFSINVTPTPSRAAYYGRLYNEIKNTQRNAIINNPQLLHKYHETIRANAQLLHTMILGKTPAERIKAQLSVNQLELIDLFTEGEVLANAKSCIQNFLLQKDYINPAFTLEQRGKLLEISAPFFKEASEALNQPSFYTDFIKECVEQNIPGAKLLLDRHTGQNSWGDKANNFFMWFLPEYRPQNLNDRFNENAFIKDYLQLEHSCRSQNFSESQSIIDSYTRRLWAGDSETVASINNELHALRITHDHYFREVFNEYEIRYEHTDDPYYVVAKQLLKACPLEHKQSLLETVQQTITVRQEKMAQLFSTLKTDGKNPVVRAYGYRLIDAQTPQEVVNILASLSGDHKEANCAAAYGVFFADCVPKWMPPHYQPQIDMPRALSLEANTKARILYGNCLYFQSSSKEQENRLAQIAGYISQSCTDQKQSNDYLYLAEKLYQSLAQACSREPILQCPNFNTAFTNPEQIRLKSELVSVTVDCLKKIEETQAKAANASDMELLIQDIGKVFTAVKEGKLQKAHTWMEKVIKQAINQGSITPEVAHYKNSLIAREILSKCNVMSEDTPFPQCFIPENKEWIFPDEYGFDEPKIPFTDACLPGLLGVEKFFDWAGHSPDNPDLKNTPQCNWGKQQQLPSLGESEKNTDDKIAEHNESEHKLVVQEKPEQSQAEYEGAREKNLDEELEELKKEILNGKSISQEQEKQLDDFLESLKDLVGKYGIDNVLEACEVSNLSLYKVKKGTVIHAINELAEALKEINKDPEGRAFKFEHAQNGEITRSSIQEAIAGKTCMDQKLLGKLRRAELEGDDFIEIATGKSWDVKTARSKSLDGEYIFDIEAFIRSLQDGYADGENIIIQVTNLSEEDLETFYKSYREKFTFREFEKTIIVDGKTPSRSKSTIDLVKFMRDL